MGGGAVGPALLTAAAEGAADAADDDAAAPLRPSSHRRRSLAFATLALLAAFLLVRAFVAEPVRVRSDSMEPTYHDGDLVLVDRLGYRFGDPRIGDVVVADVPESDDDIVKRVAAVAGDVIGIEEGVLIVNGRPVDEPYLFGQNVYGTFFGPVEVPDGHVFLLGDNRAESVDSRGFGPVPISAIDGQVRVTLWPPG